jgi:DNA-binding NarL/FixJ family response regulator
MKPARILIADDHEVFRRGLRSVLAEVAAWQVIAEAGDGVEAVQLATALAPDIVVIDLSMPRLNGLDAARQIRGSLPTTQVLIVTAHESEQVVREVLDAGALGYLLKSDAGALLVKAIESLLEGRPFFTSKVGNLVLEGYLRTRRDGVEVEPLSPRERHIVQLLAEGRSNKEVARALQISVKTVETHRSNIMRKMGFTSLADLVRYAVRNKIVEA